MVVAGHGGVHSVVPYATGNAMLYAQPYFQGREMERGYNPSWLQPGRGIAVFELRNRPSGAAVTTDALEFRMYRFGGSTFYRESFPCHLTWPHVGTAFDRLVNMGVWHPSDYNEGATGSVLPRVGDTPTSWSNR